MCKTSKGCNVTKGVLNKKGDKTVLRTMRQFHTQNIKKKIKQPLPPAFFLTGFPCLFASPLFMKYLKSLHFCYFPEISSLPLK